MQENLSNSWPVGLSLGHQSFTPAASRVAILGAGVMGPGIAMVFAEHGFQVDLCEVQAQALDAGLASLADALQLKVETGMTTQPAATRALARVSGTLDIDAALAGAHLVVEVVSENKAIKREVFERIARLAPAATPVWSNTSTLDVFSLAPPALAARLAVAHWFAPAHILPLVEVVAGPSAPASLVGETAAVLRALGKAPVVLNKFIPGFVINRLLRALGREAFDMLEDGVISIENLDAAVRTSLAPRMQVLGLMQRYDYTGLNLSLRNLGDTDIVDAPLNRTPAPLVQRVERGELGVSAGRGFYDYGGRSTLELQRERDRRLWQAMNGLGTLASAPEPI